LFNFLSVNGLGAPGVLPPFALGLGTPLTGGYSNALPNLAAFSLANSGALQTAAPAMRGYSNVLLVSNLNEEVSALLYLKVLYKLVRPHVHGGMFRKGTNLRPDYTI